MAEVRDPVEVVHLPKDIKDGQSRSVIHSKIGFEGGQMPLQRRVPKFGFNNMNRKEYKAINISTLQTLAEARKLTSIDAEDPG